MEVRCDDFLKNVRSRFKPCGLKHIKCLFVIEKIQQSAFENLWPILNTRYWTNDGYKAIYLNDFVFCGLRQNILSKVIVNDIDVSNFCETSEEEIEIDEFKDTEKRIEKFKETVFPVWADNDDDENNYNSFVNTIFFTIRFNV